MPHDGGRHEPKRQAVESLNRLGTTAPLPLPTEYTARPARRDDADSVAALLTACRAVTGEAPVTSEDLLDDWDEMADRADGTVVVLAPDGRLVAEADLLNRRYVRVSAYGNVLPEEEGKGLGSFLVGWAERWMDAHLHLAPAAVQVVLEFYANGANNAARRLLESRGYPLVRTVYVMRIDLTSPPPAPRWPPGIKVRTFRRGEDEEVLFVAGEEAFRDIWSRPPGTVQSWSAPTRTESFDPSLWFLPVDTASGKVAGVCLCIVASSAGWVRSLGVRPPWRKQGLGLALLHHAFGEMYERGIRRIELSVDADSSTGAPRLYTRAGMGVAQSYGVYRREIRPGADFTTALT